jgi:hypothetical protein
MSHDVNRHWESKRHWTMNTKAIQNVYICVSYGLINALHAYLNRVSNSGIRVVLVRRPELDYGSLP